ncbi:MAG: hypothetical protein ACPL28_10185 [bacterium]
MGKKIKIDKISLLRFINGYKRANKLIFRERMRRLANLSIEESLREYLELCKLAEECAKELESKEILKKRLDILLKRRRLFNINKNEQTIRGD